MLKWVIVGVLLAGPAVAGECVVTEGQPSPEALRACQEVATWENVKHVTITPETITLDFGPRTDENFMSIEQGVVEACRLRHWENYVVIGHDPIFPDHLLSCVDLNAAQAEAAKRRAEVAELELQMQELENKMAADQIRAKETFVGAAREYYCSRSEVPPELAEDCAAYNRPWWKFW